MRTAPPHRRSFGYEVVEVGNAVPSADDSLSIDDDRAHLEPRHGADDQREAVAPVVPAPGVEPHAIAITRTISRYPSCLISWTHADPVGTRFFGVGRHGGMNMARQISATTGKSRV
jgi:hypothetical protein